MRDAVKLVSPETIRPGMTRSDRYWLGLVGVTTTAFLVGEGHAFYTKNADGTLTAWGGGRIRRNRYTRAAWWLSMAWLAYHMDSGRLGVPWQWEVPR